MDISIEAVKGCGWRGRQLWRKDENNIHILLNSSETQN